MNGTPSETDRKIVETWITQNAKKIFNDFEDWYLATTDLPADSVSSGSTKVKSIRSIDLETMRLLSITQSQFLCTISAIIDVSIRVSADDYQRSEAVREWMGEMMDADATSCYVDFAAPVSLTLELTILKSPPMVTSYSVKKLEGQNGSVTTQ